MEYDQKAKQLVDQRTIELAQAICDASVSEEGALWLLVDAGVVLQLRVRLGLAAPKFKERAAAAQETTTAEPGQKPGKDRDSISSDRPAGGD